MTSILVALALSASTAEAKPYMWGVGPTVSTMVIPGQHPVSWPQSQKIDGERQDIGLYGSSDSGRLAEPYFDKVRGDVAFGGRGMLYLNSDWRGAMRGQFGFGSNYRSSQLTLEVDKILAGENGAFVFLGGGAGVGSMTFKSQEDSAYLKLRDVPLRFHGGGYYKINQKSAIELSLFFQLPIPSMQVLNTDEGNEIDMTSGVNIFSYSHFGVELTGYYGDFSKPRSGRGKGKKR